MKEQTTANRRFYLSYWTNKSGGFSASMTIIIWFDHRYTFSSVSRLPAIETEGRIERKCVL